MSKEPSPNLTAIDFAKMKAESGKKDDNFQLTPDEAKRLEEKMKDPEFMKLWVEYAQSLADPKVREEEEAYLRQVEEEAKSAGDDSFDFIFPTPHFAVELTDCPDKLKDHRVAVNMCSSDKVEKFREETTGNRQGSHWFVPVSVGPQRVEKKSQFGADWEVYDAVFNPQTIDLAYRSDRFRVFLCEIAVEHINGGYKRRFDFKFTMLPAEVKSLGTPKNQTVRRPKDNKNSGYSKEEDREISMGPIRAKFADDNQKQQSQQKKKSSEQQSVQKEKTAAASAAAAGPKKLEGNVPMTVMHRGEIDLTDAWNWSKLDKRIGIPKELVLRAQLPGVASARDIEVEVLGGVKVEVGCGINKLKGSMLLDFTVEEDPVSAKFDKTKKELTLVFRVVPPPAPPSATAPPAESADKDEKQQQQEEEEKEDSDEEAAAQRQKEQMRKQRAEAEKESEGEEMKNRLERAKHAAEALQRDKEQKQQDAEKAAAAAAVEKQQKEAAAAKMREEQDRWLKEEAVRKEAQQQKEREDAAAAAAAVAAATERKKKQQQEEEAKAAVAEKKRKEEEEAAAAAAEAKNRQEQAAAATAAAAPGNDDNEILLLDDDDEDFQLPAEQKAQMEEAAAMKEIAKKKADAEKQEELLQAQLDKKMKALPLTNGLIFRID